MSEVDLNWHKFVAGAGNACKICGDSEWSNNHDDDEDEQDPMGWVMQRERERKKYTITCECGWSTHDRGLMDLHSCDGVMSDEEQFGGYCEDYPACGHEAGDCFGRKYGSDASIKQFWGDVYSSGMSEWEIADLEDRMDHGY